MSLLALNGLRVSEAIGANIEGLGLERGHRTLTVVRKGDKTVTMPLAPRVARAIDLAIGERTEGPIFVEVDGRQIDRHAAGRIVRRIVRRAGLTKRVGPHTLRHAFITAALDAGVPLRDVKEAASHADPRTTMRYDPGRQPSTGTPPTSSPPSSPAPHADPNQHRRSVLADASAERRAPSIAHTAHTFRAAPEVTTVPNERALRAPHRQRCGRKSRAGADADRGQWAAAADVVSGSMWCRLTMTRTPQMT